MSEELIILVLAALSLGFIHTLLGPDHYLPFTAMAKARRWSIRRTVTVTVACGAGHVAGSILLGFAGIWFGLSLGSIAGFDSLRGSVAAWLLITFGLLYFIWGIRRAVRSRPHSHWHHHPEKGTFHHHNHSHEKGHVHLHPGKEGSLTPWVLFIIFILGPCEPLIPLLIYPAARESFMGVLAVSIVFGLSTIATMVATVLVSSYGLGFLRFGRLERYSHSLAGATICLSGVAIRFLGL